ncbi:MAG: ABC transporter substrate-binding protein [Mesotoga sp.]|uniref:ABC transporter substrate-binding protein n=1 Tax=Mesotoga sp. TaxID=2053577 RepID=UPI0035674230
MRKRLTMLLLVTALVFSGSIFATEKGPISDIIYFNVKMSQELGLRDVAEGLTDIFMEGVSGPTLMGMDQATRDKMDIYSVPALTYSLFINPYPNQAPYFAEVGGKDFFNVMAINEFRYALNDLINRQYVVDEILGGAGGPMLSMATPGQPGTYRYGLVANKLGLSFEGNETRAIEAMRKALEEASKIPENQGRLVERAGKWYFDNEPVTVRFVIRADDPNVRVKIGEYVSLQLEKTGVTVDRLVWERSKASNTAYGSDPADMIWNLYTEAWSAGATRAFWEHIVRQMYSTGGSYMPGRGTEGFWNFRNKELDELIEKAYTGNFLTEEEYWDLALTALEMGLKDAVRLYLCYQDGFYTANSARLVDRFAYGLGDGLNEWSLKTAVTDDKVLFVTQYSSVGALFMSNWDPVGPDGISDTYSANVVGILSDSSSFESPASAINTPYRVSWTQDDIVTKVERNDEGDVVGMIDVPENAIRFDSETKQWKEVGPGIKSMSMGTYTLLGGNMHQGQPITVNDYLYAYAFRDEWISRDGENDKYYEASYENYMRSSQDTIKGYVVNDDGTITSYFDYNFPASVDRTANWGAPFLGVHRQPFVIVSWEIYEALSEIVANGSKSGTVYAFRNDPAITQIDVLVPNHVKDIRAKLVELKENGHIPNSLKGLITVEEAQTRYQAAIDFIDKYGHAYISNGPYYLSKYDPTANYAECRAFRDPSYPYEPYFWKEALKTVRLSIDSIEVPAIIAKGMDTSVQVVVAEIEYPSEEVSKASRGSVVVTLITPDGEISFDTVLIEPGIFEAMIPAEAIESLEPGSYNVLAIASLEGAVPASSVTSTIVY